MSLCATRQTTASKATRKAFAKPPRSVAITGAAGQVSYSIIFRVASYPLFFTHSGELLGPDQPVILKLIDQPGMEGALSGVRMELEDCGSPLIANIDISTKLSDGFRDADYAFLVGARPRGPGMERKDLMLLNAEIFAKCGQAIEETANRNVKVLVVGNPCNTNCLICSSYAPRIPRANFCALTKLDHNRSKYQVKEGVKEW